MPESSWTTESAPPLVTPDTTTRLELTELQMLVLVVELVELLEELASAELIPDPGLEDALSELELVDLFNAAHSNHK